MCGISGIWNLNGEVVSQELGRAFNNSLKHRGPDDEGYYTNGAGSLLFGHRRLSIIDLSQGGHQPMPSVDGRFVIVYNGEIYNFLELRTELKSLGHTFRSDSDTEVLLTSFREWGTECLNRFNGMWAIAIWDNQEQNIFLARDRFGIKPLYFKYSKDQFSFASETVAFRALPEKRKIHPVNLSLSLANVFSLEGYGKTMFDGIEQIRPGHWARVSRDGFETRKWWETKDQTPEIPPSYDDQVIRFREIFEDACRLRLRSDVPVATALSGGLDSSSVYCVLRKNAEKWRDDPRASSDWQRAFTRQFIGAENDETEYAKQVIESVGGNAVYIGDSGQSSEIADRIVRETLDQDYVYLTPPVAESIYASMRANGVLVSMDGHGVDEMLAGYPHLVLTALSEAIRSGDQDRVRDLQNTYEQMTGTSLNVSTGGLARKVFSVLPDSVQSLYRKMKRPAGPEKWLLRNSNIHEAPRTLEGELYENFHLTLLPTILRNFDRASMRSGIEIRMPFMDYRLVSFVFGLPDTSKLGGGFTKRILRDAMRGILPESIRTRKLKVGLNAPMPEWFSGELKNLLNDSVTSRSFVESSIWNGKEISKFVQDKTSWNLDECTRVWPFVAAHLIQEAA